MATEPTVMPESPVWEEAIYLLNVLTDYALGYNPADDTDGAANIQWQQLTNRTRFLRDILEKEHTVDGVHHIKADDLAEGTVIDESQLALTMGTKELAEAIAAEKKAIADLLNSSMNINDLSVSIVKCIARLLPIVQKYTIGTGAYELFLADFTLMKTTGVYNLCVRDNLSYAEIEGDDSLDLDTVEGLEVGETYVIHDGKGSKQEVATIKTILKDDNRVRFTEPLTITRESGVLSCTSLYLSNSEARTFTGEFHYFTDYLDPLMEYNSGSLYINRTYDQKSKVTPQAWYNVLGSDSWVEMQLSSTIENSDGTCTDYWDFVPGKNKVRFKVYYHGDLQSYLVNYVALAPKVNYTRIETVRQPTVVSVTYYNRNLTIVGSTYGTLYEVEHAATKLRVLSAPYVEDPYFVYDYDVPLTSMSIVLPTEILSYKTLYIQLQYIDNDGVESRWSDMYVLEV